MGRTKQTTPDKLLLFAQLFYEWLSTTVLSGSPAVRWVLAWQGNCHGIWLNTKLQTGFSLRMQVPQSCGFLWHSSLLRDHTVTPSQWTQPASIKTATLNHTGMSHHQCSFSVNLTLKLFLQPSSVQVWESKMKYMSWLYHFFAEILKVFSKMLVVFLWEPIFLEVVVIVLKWGWKVMNPKYLLIALWMTSVF